MSTTIRRRKVPSRRRKDGLIRYAKDNTSQNGEDGIIARLFKFIPTSTEVNCKEDNAVDRWCVDVGAWDGEHLSNTNSLLIPPRNDDISTHSSPPFNDDKDTTYGNNTKIRWKGVLIEGDDEKFKKLSSLHKSLGNVCINKMVSCLQRSHNNLPNILHQLERKEMNSKQHTSFLPVTLPKDFDLLNIDVDGADFWILHSLLHSEFEYRPKVLCIEFNPTMPHSLIYIQPRSDHTKHRHGSSLAALVELAESFDYVLVETTLYNAFFVDQSLYEKYLKGCEVKANDIESLHEMSMGTELYQLYNGTIVLHGCKKLLWHRVPMNQENMQVLPKSEREHFPFAPGSINEDMKGIDCDGIKSKIHTVGGVESLSQDNMSKLQLQDEETYQEAIDMSPYTESYRAKLPNDDSKSLCAKQLLSQLMNDGFALIKGTGLSPKICQSALEATKSFLNDAPESVRRSCLTKDRARRGYSPQNSENFASLIGKKSDNDLVRKFRVGPCGGSNTINSNSLLQPNIFPSTKIWPDADKFQSAVEECEFQYIHTPLSRLTHLILLVSFIFLFLVLKDYKKIRNISQNVILAICDSLIDSYPHLEQFLRPLSSLSRINDACIRGDTPSESECKEESSSHDASILTLLNYRKGARHQGKKPLVAAHTDIGVITILLFDSGNSAVLQRAEGSQHENHIHETVGCNDGKTLFSGETNWIDVTLPHQTLPYHDPVFVVNIGECLTELCQGILPSTLHRVMPKKIGNDECRSCLALFLGLKPEEKLIFPGTGFHKNEERERTFEEWRRERIAKAAEVLRSKSSS